MKVNLKLKAMSILMAGLQETQMWAVYQMGKGNEVPSSVTKEDLTCIIAFLFKQLDWIDEGSSSQPSSCTTVAKTISIDWQKRENQAQKNSVQQLTFEPDQNDEPSKKDTVNDDTSVEIAQYSTQVSLNVEQNQDTQVENNDMMVDSKNKSENPLKLWKTH